MSASALPPSSGWCVAGRYLLNPLFRILADSRAREVMTAAALLVVLGSALAMQLSGLSMAMGAFLAGVLLSESTFRHQLEADIEPFRGMLLGLFFLAVGMSLDLSVVAANWQIVADLRRRLHGDEGDRHLLRRAHPRSGHREALERAVFMAQGGEFAFVLYSAAAAVGIIDGQANATLTAIVIISMVLTPLAIVVLRAIDAEGRAVARRRRHRRWPDRQRADHRLRPLRPDRQPAAAVARHRRLDHRQ